MDSNDTLTILAVSSSGLMREFFQGHLPPDLEEVVIYLECMRSQLFNNPSDPERREGLYADIAHRYQINPDTVEVSYKSLLMAIERAEADGRVAWRPVGEMASWEQLNGLLYRNGHATIDGSSSPQRSIRGAAGVYRSNCGPRDVFEKVCEQRLPYRVIWYD